MIFSAGRTLQEFRKLDDNHDGYVESTKLIDKIAVKSGLLKEESEQLRGWMHGTNKENLNYVDFTKFVKYHLRNLGSCQKIKTRKILHATCPSRSEFARIRVSAALISIREAPPVQP